MMIPLTLFALLASSVAGFGPPGADFSSSFDLSLCPDPSRELDVYSDASWATKNSTSGGLVLYRGILVSWWTRRQKSVSASTTEAEYHSAAVASREGVWHRDFLEDVGCGVTAPTPLFLDSKAALDLTRDPVAFKLTKHILRHAHELRDRVARSVFAPRFVETSKQLADVLTKALRSAAHLQFLSLLPDLSPPTSTPDHSTDLDLSRERGCSDTPLLPSARDV